MTTDAKLPAEVERLAAKWRAENDKRVRENADLNYRISLGQTVTFNTAAYTKPDLCSCAAELEALAPVLAEREKAAEEAAWQEFIAKHGFFLANHGVTLGWENVHGGALGRALARAQAEAYERCAKYLDTQAGQPYGLSFNAIQLHQWAAEAQKRGGA